MLKRPNIWRPKNLLTSYIIAFAVGLIVGYKAMPIPVVGILYLLISCICFVYCVQGKVDMFFKTIPYVIYTEVFVRGEAEWVPYLTLQYLLTGCFIYMLIMGARKKQAHNSGYIFLALFTFLEILNNLYPDSPPLVRTTFVNSLALLAPVVWASYNVLTPTLINKLLLNIKIAMIYLAGIVFVAHLTGGINYGLYSSSESSNGLAPVQLSGYLGVGCALFFLSIMNMEEARQRTMNIVIFSVAVTVMILTFSRGGLYFLGAIIVLFFFYNRQKLGQYAAFLALIPIAFIIYTYVVTQTGGMIVERYEQEGTSNRDKLVKVGFDLFLDYPFFGVGTGNYNTIIVKENRFPVESGPHNEFVRAAAEHGTIGIILYWGFFGVLFANILRRKQPEKQYAMYFLILFCLINVHNGLKIAVQPLLVMLAVGTPTLAAFRKRNVYTPELHTHQPA